MSFLKQMTLSMRYS